MVLLLLKGVMAVLLKLIICGFLLRLVGKAWACLGLGLIGNVWGIIIESLKVIIPVIIPAIPSFFRWLRWVRKYRKPRTPADFKPID
jgi:hypothetical protein